MATENDDGYVKHECNHRNALRYPLIAAFLLVATLAVRVRGAETETETKIPFTHLDSNLICIRVRAFDKDRTFMLNTASSNHVVDWSVIPEDFPYQRIVSHMFKDAGLIGEIVDPVPILLQGMPVEGNRSTLVMDLGEVRAAIGVSTEGFLGVELMKDSTFTLDFDEQIITLTKGQDRNADQRTVSIKHTKQGRVLAEGVKAGGTEISALISTGNTGALSLSAELFEQLVVDGRITKLRNTLSETICGTKSHRNGVLSSFTIGEYEIRDVPVDESTSNAIGVRLLKRFKVTINDQGLTLSPSAKFNTKFLRDRSGAMIFMRDDKIVVEQIYNQSAAQVSGLQVGDEIVRIGDSSVSKHDLGLVRRSLASRADEPLPITTLEVVRNGDQRISLTIDYHWPADN